MANIETNTGLRALSASELSDVNGGAINFRFTFFNRTWIFHGGDGWQSICVADDQSYSCATDVGGKSYTSSGPVPR